MASSSDVRYRQLQYEENRKLGAGLRKQQDDLDTKRGRMGIGRGLFSFIGGAIGTAGGPLGMALGAGIGSAVGSFLGAKSSKIDEVDKGKLYKGTVDEARRQGKDALEYMNKMAVRGIVSDAASAYFFAGTDIGKAAQAGSAEKLAGLGADAGLLKQAWASGSGAVGGGVGHIQSAYQDRFKGLFAGDLEGELADVATVDPMMAKPTASRLTPESFMQASTSQDFGVKLDPSLLGDLAGFEQSSVSNLGAGLTDLGEIPPSLLQDPTGETSFMEGAESLWSSPEKALEDYRKTTAGQNLNGKRTITLDTGVSDPYDVYMGGGYPTAEGIDLRSAQRNVAGRTMPQELSPLSDAMQSYQGPPMPGATGVGRYDPSMGTLSPAQSQQQYFPTESWKAPGWEEALAQFRASRDQYGRAIVGGG